MAVMASSRKRSNTCRVTLLGLLCTTEKEAPCAFRECRAPAPQTTPRVKAAPIAAADLGADDSPEAKYEGLRKATAGGKSLLQSGRCQVTAELPVLGNAASMALPFGGVVGGCCRCCSF
mmetsp:Transcript_13519/g.24317  ORF Transcript_13519/g.24317 Transcript_13519/m.24317 type:complete len:119 (+) Transcript_13519:1524-1880(+)